MDSTNQHPINEFPSRFPGALSLKDLIMIVSVAVSMTIAWGVFGTRISLMEQDIENLQNTTTALSNEAKLQHDKVARLDLRIQGNDILIDNLHEELGKKQPRRRVQ